MAGNAYFTDSTGRLLPLNDSWNFRCVLLKERAEVCRRAEISSTTVALCADLLPRPCRSDSDPTASSLAPHNLQCTRLRSCLVGCIAKRGMDQTTAANGANKRGTNHPVGELLPAVTTMRANGIYRPGQQVRGRRGRRGGRGWGLARLSFGNEREI